jgi:hypothetical protein
MHARMHCFLFTFHTSSHSHSHSLALACNHLCALEQGHDDGCGTGCEHHIRAEARARALTGADKRRFELKYIAPRLAPRSIIARPKPGGPHQFEARDYADELVAQQAATEPPPPAARHRGGARDRDGDDEEELDEDEALEEMMVRAARQPCS